MAKIPFDIKYRPQIESGEYKVETRDGRRARIICWDAIGPSPIIGLFLTDDGGETTTQNRPDGRWCDDLNYESDYDLFIVTPEEELTEFEQEVSDIVEYCKEHGEHVAFDYAKRHAKTLLALAREQLIKDGYIIEKKAFYDAVAKVDPEVMKEVSDNVDKENELAKKYLEGYTKGYKDATKFYNDSVVYRNPTILTTPSDFGCDGIRCINPQMDCINCPRKTTGGFNTTCSTSAATLHGNTSATDGKEHNPSFTD